MFPIRQVQETVLSVKPLEGKLSKVLIFDAGNIPDVATSTSSSGLVVSGLGAESVHVIWDLLKP